MNILKRLITCYQVRMRISILGVFTFFAFSLAANSQNAKVDIRINNQTIQQVLTEIEKQTGYLFVYDKNEVDLNKRVTLRAKNESVKEVLNDLFAQTDIVSAIEGRNIVLMKKDRSSSTSTVQQQNRKTVTGQVLDGNNQPVIGANIIEEGAPSNGTITDIDGYFSLQVAEDAILKISYIGYLSQDIPVSEKNNVSVILQEDTKILDEIVVVGYGTRQRRSITGAIDQVNSDVFENRPVANAVQALQGASANLIIQQRNMNPNDNTMSINIRGVSTMGNNDPLIVIDGLISRSETLNNLNPNDIENISVLKDAGSAAIYGSRSANGVILVTTKKGAKSDKPIVTFSGMLGYENPDILYQPVKGWENAMYRNQANMNSGGSPAYTPAQIRDLYEHQSEEYWYLDKIMQKGLQQNYNLNVSGGTGNSTYMVSAGYLNQESNFVGNFGIERYNFRSNLSTEYGRFKFSSIMAYNRKNERTVAGGTGNVIINSSRIPPYYYYQFEENGKWLVNEAIGDDNTMAYLKDGGYEKKDEDNFIGSLNLEVKLIEGLTAKGLVGLDLTQHHRFRRDKRVPLYASGSQETTELYIHPNRMTEDYNSKRHTLSTQFLLDFNRTFNSAHNVSGLLGVSNESYTFKASRIAWERTDEDLGLPTTDEAIQNKDNKNTNGDTDQTSITSLFGRAGYNYRDKYYGEVSFRYDGSSKFDKNHRWGFFPSFSGGWRLSEESFMQAYKEKAGDLKLRASYGILGNQNVDNYSYLTSYELDPNSYVFNNISLPGVKYKYGNPLLTWEKAANFNIGLDGTFLNNNLFIALDYFNKTTWDILLAPVVSSVFGGSQATENAGRMRNRGWELTANYKLNSGEFRHNFNLNISDSKNKVVDFGGKEDIHSNDELYKLIREGEALGSYYGLKTDGLFQSYEEIANSAVPIGVVAQPGDVKYLDQNNDDIIDDKDRVVLGNAFPRYTFGFTYDVAWKDFDLRIFLQGTGKREMFVRGELIEPFHSNYSYAIYQHQLDFWTPTNPDARWPRLVAPSTPSSTNNWKQKGSDIYLLSGAYLRVKNIQLGYTLPKHVTKRFGVEKLRLNVNAQNPLTFSKNSFIDPESSEFGNNMGGIGGVGANSARNYPTLVYYGFGIDLEF
ncbi:TonB-dependent receptor [Limibacterium fermenti]|uniref:TonB-dependent receptor n=1 Tax=Limibacterium fermenti TaxID=3229863 RepID=UPI003A651A10